MPNFLENLRLQNIFGPQTDFTTPPINNAPMPPADFAGAFAGKKPEISFGPQPDFMNLPPTPPADMVETPFDVNARMRELYQPESMATDRFNQLLGEQPQWEKPGIWRTIAAALSAFGPGGHDVGMKVATEPYSRKMQDWKTAIDPAYQAANLERQDNINKRQLAHQTVTGELTARRDDARAKTAEEANRIRADRAEVYRLKSLRPNFKFDFSGPSVLMADPTTGQVTDTGIATGSLSDADKMALGHEQKLEQIAFTGEETRTTNDARHENTLTEIEKRGEEARRTKGTASSTSATKGETPTQTKVRQYNAAREFASRNPQLAKFIKLGKSNDFTITPPGKGGFFGSVGPTPEEHKKITDAIYGKDVSVQQPSGTETTAATSRPDAARIKAAVPQGRVAVEDKDGNVFTVPTGQLSQAISQGYKEVK